MPITFCRRSLVWPTSATQLAHLVQPPLLTPSLASLATPGASSWWPPYRSAPVGTAPASRWSPPTSRRLDCSGPPGTPGSPRHHLIVEAEDIDLMREPQLRYADRDLVANYNVEEALDALQKDVGRCLIIACGTPCRFLEDNRCSIYPTRPNDCVAMHAGDEQCQSSRQAEGRPPLPRA